MPNHRRFQVLLLSGIMALCPSLRAQTADRVIVTAPSLPSVQEIVQRAVASDELRHEHRLLMECDQILTTQHLDERGGVIKTKTARVVHREGAEFALFVKGDSPMPARSTGLAMGDESARRDEDPDTETAPSTTATAGAAPAATDGQVWVNTKSGVIWKPGTEYYGKTKAGKYMSAADALAAGYHYAR